MPEHFWHLYWTKHFSHFSKWSIHCPNSSFVDSS